MVKHQLYPAASVLLRRRHIALDRGDGGTLLRIRRRPCRVWVSRWDRLGKHFGVVNARDTTTAIVAAIGDDLLSTTIERAERISKSGRLKSVTQQIVAVLAHLVARVGGLQRFQIGM